jgi:hypothetical protein
MPSLPDLAQHDFHSPPARRGVRHTGALPPPPPLPPPARHGGLNLCVNPCCTLPTSTAAGLVAVLGLFGHFRPSTCPIPPHPDGGRPPPSSAPPSPAPRLEGCWCRRSGCRTVLAAQTGRACTARLLPSHAPHLALPMHPPSPAAPSIRTGIMGALRTTHRRSRRRRPQHRGSRAAGTAAPAAERCRAQTGRACTARLLPSLAPPRPAHAPPLPGRPVHPHGGHGCLEDHPPLSSAPPSSAPRLDGWYLANAAPEGASPCGGWMVWTGLGRVGGRMGRGRPVSFPLRVIASPAELTSPSQASFIFFLENFPHSLFHLLCVLTPSP